MWYYAETIAANRSN